MRKVSFIIILVFILGIPLVVARGAESVGALFQEKSDVFSISIAENALDLMSSANLSELQRKLTAAGATVVKHINYEKNKGDKRHICPYSFSVSQVTVNGAARTLITLCIPGTTAGSWFANFDYAPSGDTDPSYLENFYTAAQGVLAGVKPYIEGSEHPPLLYVSGYSRGGACANVLGVMLDDLYGAENVYVYTFCACCTVKAGYADDCRNIFNLINPGDIITYLPAPIWGFVRAGVDIQMYASDAMVAKARAYADQIDKIAPTIADYYQKEYPVTNANLGVDTLTPYEFVQYFAHMNGAWLLNAEHAQYHLRLLSTAYTAFTALVNGAYTFYEDGTYAATPLFRQHRLDLFQYQLSIMEDELP